MQISGMESSLASAMAGTRVGRARHSLSDKPRALFMASQNMADLRALA
ncbi:hypothetical protein i01_05235 [Escherichia coli cloneA_i1]|nr:hypothetical protein i01_05235 [Escherichia coli cloneA_i1]